MDDEALTELEMVYFDEAAGVLEDLMVELRITEELWLE
jgi:hypothetical protein